MKTKFTKVSVEERLPSEQGMYMVIFKGNIVGTFNFWNEEGFIDSWKEDVDFWLEEYPDKEDEMIEMLEGCKKSLDFVYENWKYPMYFDEDGKEEPEAIEHVLYRRQELDKLLQSLKTREMTPKEKAEQLVISFAHIDKEDCKNSALICVDEIIQAEINLTTELLDGYKDETSLNYWNEVKTEIEKL